MMSRSLPPDPPSSNDESEIEKLLAEAYPSPDMPRSLLVRLDDAIEQEWGRSPGLSPSILGGLSAIIRKPFETRHSPALEADKLLEAELREQPGRTSSDAATILAPTRTLARHGFKSLARLGLNLRVLSAAAAVMLAVGFAFWLTQNSNVYAWADMLEAMCKKGLLQVGDGESSRWLSLEQQVLGERAGTVTRIWSLGSQERIEYERHGNEIRTRRTKLPSLVSRDQLALAFLLGDGGAIESGKLNGARVVRQNWKRVETTGGRSIALRVDFETTDAEQLHLDLRLNPETSLPESIRHSNIDEQPATKIDYPMIGLAELSKTFAPSDVPIVESTLAAQADTQSDRMSESLAAVKPPVNEATVNNASAAKPIPTFENNRVVDSLQAWTTLDIQPRSDDEVLQAVNAGIERLWKENDVTPTAPAGDEELLRRVYLDLAGRTPSVNEVRSYLHDDAESRYEKLVERLLSGPDHASHLATVWRSYLIPDGTDLAAFGGVESFDRWLSEQFAVNESYDEIVRNLLLAEGRLSRAGPLVFYAAAKLDPEHLAARTSRVFLGVRLECAQCHDHPFESWKQHDFWNFAAFFAQISRPQGTLEAASKVLQVRDIDRGEVRLPGSDSVIPPRFLDKSELPEAAKSAPRRRQLADWITDERNPFFARATVNRVWAMMFGKGLVDPVDDFGAMHPAKSKELLDLLAADFIDSGFSLRSLFRNLALSKAYRLSSGSRENTTKLLDNFACMHVKTLTAEQVYDCVTVASMLDTPARGLPSGLNIARFNNADRQAFLQQFRSPAGNATEFSAGIPQALTLMNGNLISGATGLATSGLLKSLEAPFFNNEQRIEVLYLATLSRRPRPSELDWLRQLIQEDTTGTELRDALADILWALLNSAEFTMNH